MPRGGPRKGAGRPAAVPGERRIRRQAPALTDAEWQRVLDYAATTTQPPGAALRDLILRGLLVGAGY